MPWFGLGSYGLAALCYAAIAAVLVVSLPMGRRAAWVTVAMGVSTAWAAGCALLLFRRDASLSWLVTIDAMHKLVWIMCVVSWLTPKVSLLGRTLSGALVVASIGAALGSVMAAHAAFGSVAREMTYPALLVLSLVGLLSIEQVYRNADPEQRDQVRLLCLAIGAIFVGDLIVFSQATMLGEIMPTLWEGRGFLNAALAPLLLIAVKGQREWQREVFVSRQVAFYTASLICVGGYLLTMSLVAYVIRATGGEWGLFLQLLFLVAALALLVVLFFSEKIRARLRVFLVKNFYKNKYDYRFEWLRLTESLGRTNELVPLARNALAAIAAIVGSRDGALWLFREARYEWMASLDRDAARGREYSPDEPVVTFLRERDWVIDSAQYAGDPSCYDYAFGAPNEGVLPPESLIVPLDCQRTLLGFVVLRKSVELRTLNFEDHDILKTAGRQAAIVLAQALGQEQLTATRQFEAVSKLSTFLMHDLKNVVAQQELLVSNAERFIDRPEFVADMVTTVRSGVRRMRKVLDQLQNAVRHESSSMRTDAAKIALEVRSQCSDRNPVPMVKSGNLPAWVLMDGETLASCLTHLVRNAQDATPPDGGVDLMITSDSGKVTIAVTDTGCGMDEAFLRERLFRPFDSTKGARGMGIGAYQVRDAVRAAGGEVEVESGPGRGTSFRLILRASSEPSYRESAA